MRIWIIIFLLFSTNVLADVNVKIIGTDDDGAIKEVELKSKDGDIGIKAFTEELGDFEPIFIPFLNPTFGI